MQSNFAISFSGHKETSFIEKVFFTSSSVYELHSGFHGSHTCPGEVIDAYRNQWLGESGSHDGSHWWLWWLVTLTKFVYNHTVQLHTNVSLSWIINYPSTSLKWFLETDETHSHTHLVLACCFVLWVIPHLCYKYSWTNSRRTVSIIISCRLETSPHQARCCCF